MISILNDLSSEINKLGDAFGLSYQKFSLMNSKNRNGFTIRCFKFLLLIIRDNLASRTHTTLLNC